MLKVFLNIISGIFFIINVSCEKNDNPFVGTWNVYSNGKIKTETSFFENYSWSSILVYDRNKGATDPDYWNGNYIYDDDKLTIINQSPYVTSDTLIFEYNFVDKKEFTLKYIDSINTEISTQKYIRIKRNPN